MLTLTASNNSHVCIISSHFKVFQWHTHTHTHTLTKLLHVKHKIPINVVINSKYFKLICLRLNVSWMPIFSVYRVFKKIWNEQNITIQVQCFQPHGRALPPCLSWMGHRDHGHHICVSVNNLWCRCRGVFKVPQLAFCHSTLHFWWLCMVI